MLSYQVYKILHLVSLFGVFMCLGSLIVHRMNGGDKEFPARRWVMLSFVVFMFLALVGGFGSLVRLEIGMPVWVFAKFALWFVVGAYMSVILRKPEWSKLNWFVLLLLGATGAYLAIYKPF